VSFCRYCQQAIRQFVDALGWGVLVLHDAKGMFTEEHPAFVGTFSPFYCSPVSVQQVYEAADALLFVGKHSVLLVLSGAVTCWSRLACLHCFDIAGKHAHLATHPRSHSHVALLSLLSTGTHFNEMTFGQPPDQVGGPSAYCCLPQFTPVAVCQHTSHRLLASTTHADHAWQHPEPPLVCHVVLCRRLSCAVC
jgi:hypothetical protein